MARHGLILGQDGATGITVLLDMSPFICSGFFCFLQKITPFLPAVINTNGNFLDNNLEAFLVLNDFVNLIDLS